MDELLQLQGTNDLLTKSMSTEEYNQYFDSTAKISQEGYLKYQKVNPLCTVMAKKQYADDLYQGLSDKIQSEKILVLRTVKQ